jgi:hypothetical protein
MDEVLPVLEVVLVANHHDLDLVMGIVLDLEEPLVETVEGIALGEVEDEEGGDGALVVGSRDGLEGLLSGLTKRSLTVSQIWILMV